jgi:hypothetical protein
MTVAGISLQIVGAATPPRIHCLLRSDRVFSYSKPYRKSLTPGMQTGENRMVSVYDHRRDLAHHKQCHLKAKRGAFAPLRFVAIADGRSRTA